MKLTFGELKETPIGPISFIAGDAGLRQVSFASLMHVKTAKNYIESEPSLEGLETIGTLLIEINEFLFGIRKSFSIDVDWSVIKGFQDEVLRITADIPYGELMTYGEIADRLGKPGSARAVGRALGSNPMPIVIPCHRVIGSDRKLRGYTAPEGIKTKAFLLEHEGHKIEDDRIVAR